MTWTVWDAYREAVIDVYLGDGMVTVGLEGVESDQEWRPPDGIAVHIITAYNPGAVVDDSANQAAQGSLIAEIRRLHVRTWAAVGRNRASTWAEPSLAIMGLTTDEAIALGSLYGQDAIFEWTEESLAVLPCRSAVDGR